MCDDRVARLVVLLLGDPPLLAGGERGEDDAVRVYLRSGGAMILTFMEAGASAVSSLQKRVYDLLRAFRERPAALGFRKSLVGSPQSSNRLHASRIAQKPQNSQNRAVEGLESVRRPRAPGSRHFTPPAGAAPREGHPKFGELRDCNATHRGSSALARRQPGGAVRQEGGRGHAHQGQHAA